MTCSSKTFPKGRDDVGWLVTV